MDVNKRDQILKLASASCTAHHLRRTMRAVNHHFDALIRSSGLRPTQFTLVSAVHLEAPITVTHLAALMGMDRTTLTRNLKPLERDGLLRLSPGEDRRTRIVETTAAGEAVLANAIPLWQQAQEPIVAAWGQDRFDRFLGDLAEMESLVRMETIT